MSELSSWTEGWNAAMCIAHERRLFESGKVFALAARELQRLADSAGPEARDRIIRELGMVSMAIEKLQAALTPSIKVAA